MTKDLSEYRKSYQKSELKEKDIPEDPFGLFKTWFIEQENQNDGLEVNAMTVSSIGKDGFPKSRVVLLKEFDETGFTFYTNYTSEKGEALVLNPHTCLSFFWPFSERQIIIKGIASKNSEEKSKRYFHSRPRGSQLGAWASDQSKKVASREVLDKCLMELETKFEGQEIPKPEFWGGFTVAPKSFEFWQGRDNRLHDRFLYEKENNHWVINRLAP